MTARLVRLGLAGWRGRWLTSALAFVLVALGSGAALLSLQLRDVAERPWERTFAATNGAHLLAFGSTADVGRLSDVEGVVEAAGPAPMVVTSMEVEGATYGLRAVGVDEPPAVERPVITDGRWMVGDGEVVLERSLAVTIGVEVGDDVGLRRVDGTVAFTVVGLAVSAREASYPDNQPGDGFVRRSDLAAMQPDEAKWTWVAAVRLVDASQADAVARAAFADLPPRTGIETYESRVEDASEPHRMTTIVLRIFGVTLLVVVALVMATLASARVLDRADELGLLKAVGFTPLQVTIVVAIEQVVVAVVAAVAGALAGNVLTPRIVRRTSELLGTVPVEVSITRIATAVGVVVAAVAIAAAVPTWRLARSGVLRSLSTQRGGAINRLARRIPLRAPLPAAIAVKQVVARPGRSIATGLALALTVASLVAGLAFEATVANEDQAEMEAIADRPIDPAVGELAPGRPDPVPMADSTREQLRPIVHGFNAVLIAVAVVNLLATALLSLRRRRRDLALTRAVGFTPQQVRRSVFWSDGLVGLMAALAGIPLGAALFLGVYRLVNGDTELAELPPGWQLALVPVVCVAAVVGVIAIPAHQAASQSVIAGLHHE